MKKISLILVSLVLACNFVMAQGGNSRATSETAQEKTDRMVKEYSLNAEQKTQLKKINEQSVQEAQKRSETVRTQSGSNNSERAQLTSEQRKKTQAEVKVARKDYDAKVKKVLTKKQFKAYQKKEKEERSTNAQQK